MLAFDWKRRAVLVLVVALGLILLAACDALQPPPTVSSARQPAAVRVSIAPVTTGNISVTAAYAAIVEPKYQVDVVPLATGRIETLVVDIGSEVSEGEVVAELSHGTLDAQLEQAGARLRGAQVHLESVKANAEPKRIKAQAQLDAAVAKLDQLSNPLASEVLVAESAVTKARVLLDSEKIELEQLLNPTVTDVQALVSAVAAAQSGLDSAGTKLEQLLNPTASDLQTAESAVSTAQSNLDSKNTTLDQLLNPTAAALAAALETVSDAQSSLSTVQTTVNTAISSALAEGTIAADLRLSWELLLDARVTEQANTATLRNPALSSALTAAEIADTEQAVATSQETISRLLADITSSSLIPEAINTAMSAEASSQTTLETAEEELKELRSPSANAVAKARNDVAIVQAGLDTAQANLLELQSADQNTIALAQNNVAIAQAALDTANARLAGLQTADQGAIALAQYDVDAAQASLESAEASWDLVKTASPADLAAAEAAVASAEHALALAQEPYTGYEIETAQALVDSAQAQVEMVEQQLAELKVFAPFDGFVTERWLAAGAMASVQTPIVTVASSDVVVSLRIEETGIGSLQVGQRVNFTSPALPGGDSDLLVDRIAPTGDEKTYTFLVQLRPAGEVLDLRPGMSGQVTFVTLLEDVALVPKEAILRQGSQSALFVVQGDKAHLQKVDIGLIDDTNMEIRGGILPGDQVVVAGHNLLSEGDTVIIEASPAAATSGR